MANQSAAEAKQQAIDAMGDALGVQYAELWQELAQLNITWSEFMELYGTKRSRIELMNRSAGGFFRMVQDSLWERLMLHIARLTDRSAVLGRKNLTLHNLPALIPDATLKSMVEALCLEATTRRNSLGTGATVISRIATLTWLSAPQQSRCPLLQSSK